MDTAAQIIEKFDLKPHPEGGFYKQTYKASNIISERNLGAEFAGSRYFCTCIYYLLDKGSFSAFHRIKQDEIWHFYKGSAIELHMISPKGRYSNVNIGNDIRNGEVPQFVVPAHYWFAANLVEGGIYSLVGCTVSPGFDFRDFEIGDRGELIRQFPDFKNIILKLTKEK